MYCNYSKDKFGSELTFIQPPHLTDLDIKNAQSHLNSNDWCADNHSYRDGTFSFLYLLQEAEDNYKALIDESGWKPQEARAVLPNALKTELVMTGFVSDWKHFFSLRCPVNAHPSARELAIPLKEEFIKRKYI